MTESLRSALIYARISQDREGAGLGVERQVQDCRKLAARLGWTVVGEHRDDDISAYSGKPRPGYKSLLADLEAARATGVLAWHNDRLHRSPTELERYIDICEAHGVITHTVQAGELDLSTPTGRMQARIVGAVSRHESEHKSERIKRARQQNAEAGGWHGGARPFGFEADGVTHREAEAAVIREATAAMLAGASLRSVVRTANDSGLLTTFKRETWSINSFREILQRPRNAGLRKHQGEIIGKAVWEAIVPEEQWRALMSILTDPQRKTSPGNRVRWLGSGLYVCGECGEPSLIVSTSGASRLPAYRCRKPGKGHVVRGAAPLDEYVEAVIVERLAAADAGELLRPLTPAVDLESLRSDANAARERLREIAAMFGEGDLSVTEARIARTRAKKRLELAEVALNEATVATPLAGLAGAPDIAEVWPTLELGRRRAVLDALMTVTVMRILGKRPQGGPGWFDPAAIKIEWKIDD